VTKATSTSRRPAVGRQLDSNAVDNCANTLAPVDEADDRWPADFDDNKLINISGAFFLLPPYYGSSTGGTYFSARRDIVPDSVVNVSDMYKLLPPFFGFACT